MNTLIELEKSDDKQTSMKMYTKSTIKKQSTNQPIKQQPGKQLRGSQSLSDSIICYIDHSLTTATSCSGRLNFW